MIIYRAEIVVRPGRWRDLLALLKRARPEALKWRMLQCQNGPGGRWVLEEEYESLTAMEAFWNAIEMTPQERTEFYREYDEYVESTVARDYLLVVHP